MPFVDVRGIGRAYSGAFALHDISISLDRGQILTLMGPSGSGKTSLLRNLCGLDIPDTGRISIGGSDLTRLPPQKRGIGLIFQDLALFPHMTVFENIAYGLRARRESAPEVGKRVRELASMLDIRELLERYPPQVSGGQRQRVALARSVAASPSLLLLDEPLSSLDRQLRSDVRRELKQLSSSLGLTMIYVTHDHHEGLYMADRAAVMFDGAIERTGEPRSLFMHPGSERIARFFGYNVFGPEGSREAFHPAEFEFCDGGGDMDGVVVSSGYEGEFTSIHVRTEQGEMVQLAAPADWAAAPADGERVSIKLRRVESVR